METSDLALFAQMALDCVHREYPNHLMHAMASDDDVRPPRELSPCFYGCFDWHSAVHGHWLLARLARLHPDAWWARPAREALGRTLDPAKVAREVAYMSRRPAFERPYGIAWLLRLHAELDLFEDLEARSWAASLAPMARLCADRFAQWLPGLSHPIRTGTYSQTSFALGLVLEWTHQVGEVSLENLLRARATAWHEDDRELPLHVEPSGEDFLSPALGVADLMGRVMQADEFAVWLHRALPVIQRDASPDWIPPVSVEHTEGMLTHLDGLNISRAWMLYGIATALPNDDARIPVLRRAADTHRRQGLATVTGERYEGGHWLGSFAVYLLTSERW